MLIAAAAGFCQSNVAQPNNSREMPLSIIVVPSSSQAQQIVERLKRGEDFAVIAREQSSDATAKSGGYMGTIDPMNLRPELRDALLGLAPGAITGIVRIPSGYAIVKVLRETSDERVDPRDRNRLAAISATSNIRYMPNVSGIGEAESTFFRAPKPPGWDQDLRQICQTRKDTLANATRRMEALLSPAHASELALQEPLNVSQEFYSLGELDSYTGKMDDAIKQYLKGYEIAVAKLPALVPQFEEELGLAYLHKSEMDNGVYTAPGDRCLMPMSVDKAFARKGDSEQAVQHFEKYLATAPDDAGVKWLLNYAYMTLGRYPAGVPKQYLVPPSVFESEESAPRFKDVAVEAGLKLTSMAGGAVIDDFENNGLLDVVTSSFDVCEPMHYFHNNGDGTFSDRSEQAGVRDQLGGLNMVQADYNNDGCMDILVLRGGWEIPMRKSLLRGDCHGHFTDVTREAGLSEPATATQTAAWADINRDGWLDLFVGNENGAAQLFLSKGDGTFVDIAHSAGVDKVSFAKAVTTADYDNDGWPDFYVANFAGDNLLYHNNHDNTFTESARQAGVMGPWQSFPTWFFDYDNDGWPDLLVNSYFLSADEGARTYLHLPHNAVTTKLYRNIGYGKFRDVTAETHLDKVLMPMGANFGDIDNDGFLDVYLGSGNPNYGSLIPHMLLRNHDGKYFADVTTASGTGELHKGHGVSFADLDRDGDEDIFTVTGGAVPGDAHALRLFENPGNGNDWVNLKLTGVKTNRAAIGARIKVTVENEGGGRRMIFRAVDSGGSFGASPLEQHIGLGKSARIVSVDVWWPVSNTKQTFTDVPKNRFLGIQELAPTFTVLERKPVRLGGAQREAKSAATAGSKP